MNLNQYIESVNKHHRSGISSEHTFRADLESLIRELVTDVEITNEPSKVTDCGNPDYVITKKKIPIGFIEAKDLGKDLNSKTYKEQFDRYRKALDNLIITDYLWFRFYQNGELVHEIRIGEIDGHSVNALSDNFTEFTNLIQNFCTFIGQTIKSSKKLASMMAAKARLLQNILENAVTSDEETQANSTLKDQFETFKSILIHDLDPKGFADIYAQTLAYGMFAARLHDKTLQDFSRQEAAELIPKSNPFLRKLFGYVAGPDIDERIVTTVDNLADVFRATNVEALLKNFGKSTQTHDPIIHFYETFLAEYDAKLRKARGVWYTPEPVVKFIVRSVDEILKTEFGLKDGLADTSKTTIEVEAQGTAQTKGRGKGKKLTETREVHRVQVLDPATGTGTFLAEVVKFIYDKKFKSMQGAWSGYVEDELIPRLNGFELLMASYSMAHLKLDMLLTETGYKPKKEQRFNVFLTNSLEEHHPDTGTLFSSWLSSEANEANKIKRDTPVMCVIGNPPYSVSSSNKSEWIEDLMQDYKKNLNEHNIQPLSDDYIKFIRFGQHLIEKNGEGILAYISNNSFIDGLIHRQMRKDLLETFDQIYLVDLHGNSKKKETTPTGGKDQNVFDIMAGVSINIFVKKNKKETKNIELAKIYFSEIYGSREEKYNDLDLFDIYSKKPIEIKTRSPEYYFSPKDFGLQDEYDLFIPIIDLFGTAASGVTFRKDSLLVKNNFTLNDAQNMVSDVVSLPKESLLKKFNFKETKDWEIEEQRLNFTNPNISDFRLVQYRPFDLRWTYYPLEKITKIIPRGDSRKNLMKHLIKKENFSFICLRQTRSGETGSISVARELVGKDAVSSLDRCTVFPIYLYPDEAQQDGLEDSARKPNLNTEIVQQIADAIKLQFTPEKENNKTTFAPIDILDYIYAVLHSPNYRQKYKEFLKIDFPRVPYPKDQNTFWKLVALGGELRQIHLLESDKVEDYITSYPEEGDNQVTRKITKTSPGYVPNDTNKQQGKVYINDTQYFDNVPLKAWEFYIGGYQPAQKWLKDRKGRELSYDDIRHYQKIIVALSETDRIMQEIDKIEIEK